MKKLVNFLKSKSFRIGLIILTLIAFSLYIMDYFYGVKVQANQDTVSIGLTQDRNTIIPTPQQVYSEPKVVQTATNAYQMDFSGEKVDIGVSNKDFLPIMKFWRFGNESSVELSLIGGGRVASFTTSTLSNGIITADNQYFTLQYSAVPQKAGFNELGGLDLRMTLKRNPGLNVITFTYNKQSAEGYLQPPLTTEYTAGYSSEFQCNIGVNETAVWRIDDGRTLINRPDYVVNSIAFYIPTKNGDLTALGGKNYKTGKIGQLYRMKVTDAANRTTWADWGFGGGNSQITLTVPLAFFNAATYPVIIEPAGDTFGFSSIGGTSSAMLGENTWFGSLFTAPASGTATNIKAYMKMWWSGDTGNLKGTLVTHSDLNIITNGIGGASDQITSTAGWKTSNFASSPSITSSTDYVISAVIGNAAGTFKNFVPYYDVVSGLGHSLNPDSYASPTNPTGAAGGNEKYSIYCTYTPAAGDTYDITNSPSSKAFGTVAVSTTYWAIGHTPDNPIDDSHCTFTLTSTGSATTDIDFHAHNFTGGVGWTLTSNAPSTDEVRLTVYLTGANPSGGGTVLTTADQEIKSNLASGGHTHFDLTLETGSSFTDGVEKSGTITITGRAP